MRIIHWIASVLSEQQLTATLIWYMTMFLAVASTGLDCWCLTQLQRTTDTGAQTVQAIYHRICETLGGQTSRREQMHWADPGGSVLVISVTGEFTQSELFSTSVCARGWEDSAGADDGWTGQRLQSSGISLIGTCYSENESVHYCSCLT